MKRLNKGAVVLGLAAGLALGGTITSFAGNWQTDSRGWIYQKDDGTYAANEWVYHNNVYYFVNSAGVMVTNQWVTHNGAWYWVDENGAMLSNCAKMINGKWYRFNSNGTMVTGWYKDGSKWFYFDGSGAMVTGWVDLGGTWYYLGESDGSMTTGWLDWGGNKYYLFSDGHMAIGVQTVDGKEQLFRTDGIWVKDADTNNGQSTNDDLTVASLFNAAYEDMGWDDIESLAKKYYSNFYQTSSNAIATINTWRDSNKVKQLTFSSSLTKAAFALAITNKSFDYFGADCSTTSGVVEYKECAELFDAELSTLTMARGETLSAAIQKLYNKEQLEAITKPAYTACGFGFVRLDDGTFIVVVMLN